MNTKVLPETTHPQAPNLDTSPSNPETAISKALTILQQGVTNLVTSDGWQAALAFRQKFHQYSFFNSTLIYAQNPAASYVAGYKTWQSLGRQVSKGEKGIAILAPLIKKLAAETNKPSHAFATSQSDNTVKENETSPATVVGFKISYVFDVSQTTGADLPLLPRPKVLEDDTEQIQSILTALYQIAVTKGLTIKHLATGSALGFYRPADKLIALRTDLPPLQTLKTLIHELAHALLHDPIEREPVPNSGIAKPRGSQVNRSTAELEAESCAFLVCHQLGLDTSQYSFAYLAHWTDDLEQLLTVGDKAAKAATGLLESLQVNP